MKYFCFSFNDHVSRGRLLIRSVFLCLLLAGVCTLRAEARFPQLLLYFKPGELQIKFVPSFLKKLCEM